MKCPTNNLNKFSVLTAKHLLVQNHYLPLEPPFSDSEITVLSPWPGAPVVCDHGVEVTQGTPRLTAAALLHVDIGGGRGRGNHGGGPACGHLSCGHTGLGGSHQGVCLTDDPQGLAATSFDDCPRLVLVLWRMLRMLLLV